MDNFLKRKKDVLSKLDKSSKGNWDKRISNLCMKINSSNDYYTTSSCAGRIVLMLDEEKKQGGLFIKIYHDEISFEELEEELQKRVHSQSTTSPTASPNLHSSLARGINKIDKKENSFVNNSGKTRAVLERGNLIKFKMEPCILHVACRDLNCAQKLFDKAKFIGWKKSGIISIKNHIILELNSTERLEFPIISLGKIIVDDKFLKVIVNEANKKLKKSWKKIKELEKAIK